MPLFGTPVPDLTEADLRVLLDNAVPESRTLDYKRELPSGKDADKKDFLFDVASLLNAEGGHILFGFEDQDSKPVAMEGVSLSSADQTVSGLDGSIRTAIAPRPLGALVRAVPLANGNHVVVVEIPRSFARPHMVTFKGTNKFYLRHSNDNGPMSIEEIRAAFAQTGNVFERIRAYRAERIAALAGGQAHFSASGGGWRAALHVLPLSMFDPSAVRSLDILKAENPKLLQPYFTDGWDSRFNFDGFATYAPARGAAATSFVQVYRTGVIESVTVGGVDMGKEPSGQPVGLEFDMPGFERQTMSVLPSYMLALLTLGVPPPFAVGLSLIRVEGVRMREAPGRPFRPDHKIDRPVLMGPEVLIDRLGVNLGRAMKPAFDAFWNAGGFTGSPYYGDDGDRNDYVPLPTLDDLGSSIG